MRRTLTPSAVRKELEGVGTKLAAGKITGAKRLALLRRQADLVDLSVAMADRARRRAL